MSNLEEKVIIITGGSGLLGAAFIEELRSSGATAVNADIDVGNSKEDHKVYMDITKPESVKDAMKWVIEEYGAIHGLVNNAYPRTSDWASKIEDVKLESLQMNMNNQIGGYFNCCQEAIRYFKEQEEGTIVNLASIYGVTAPEFSIYEGTDKTVPVGYAIIKAGIISYTRYLAAYYGKYGIRVNAVSPGGIADKESTSYAQSDSFVKKYEARVPLGRMGNPGDIAPTVSFLLSNGARYITGQNICIDGGWTAI